MRGIKFQIDRDGIFFVTAFAVVSAGLACLSTGLGCLGAAITLWCAYFFRDPDRVVFQNPHIIVSAADGIVDAVQQVTPPLEWGIGDEPRWRISIFLNVFDVHVNRIPCHGTIRRVLYHPGKFLNASLDKASEHNERNVVIIDQDSVSVACVQIAGLIARRIRCDIEEKQSVITGQRFGMIRFGSRVDVYLPVSVVPLVVVGQKAIGGETILADMHGHATQLRETMVV